MGTLSVYIGVDPGKRGGIAVIEKCGQRLVSRAMPVTKDGRIDVLELKNTLLFALDHVVSATVILEKAQAMPKQGVTGVFTYGVGYGELLAVFQILGLRVVEVRPAIWKKYFGLTHTTKLESCKKALEFFPAFDYRSKRGGLKDGEAEALLLAEYGRRKGL